MTPLTFATRDEWLAWRNQPGRIGASDAAMILGLSDHGSPWTVLARWHGIRQPETLAMRKGSYMEEFILREADTHPQKPGELGREIRERRQAVYVHRLYDWLGSTVDSLWEWRQTDLAVGECKDVGEHAAREWDDGAPLKHVVQGQVQMACSGLDRVCLIGLVHGDLRFHVIERNERDIETILARLVEFRDAALSEDSAKLQRYLDDSARTAEVLRRLWQPKPLKSCAVPDRLLAEMAEAQDTRRRADKEHDRCQSAVALAMQDAEIAESESYRLTWKQTKRGHRGAMRIERRDRSDVMAELGALADAGEVPWV